MDARHKEMLLWVPMIYDEPAYSIKISLMREVRVVQHRSASRLALLRFVRNRGASTDIVSCDESASAFALKSEVVDTAAQAKGKILE